MASEKNPFLIEYTVGLNYITPAVRQKIGVAGNHNAVELEFKVDEGLKAHLEANTGDGHDGGGVRYRFEVTNGVSEVFRTETFDVNEEYKFSYSLQERDTRYGGSVKVVLVLTAFDGNTAAMEVFCPSALLTATGAPHHVSRVSYTELEQKALRAADDAAEAADYVRQIKEAYDSGELKGDKGDVGPVGPKGEKGEDGKDYVLTDEDKSEISDKVSTHEKYFDITDGGVISLKPEYRGAARPKDVTPSVLLTPFDSTTAAENIPNSQSDNGWGKVGSKYYELPQEIRMPTTVNGISVTGYQKDMFAFNGRIVRVILNSNITSIPDYFFYHATNLEEVLCIEQVTAIGRSAFSNTRIKRIEFPNLTSVSQQAFRQCVRLEYIDIGKVTVLPDYLFMFCYNLTDIVNDNAVTTVGMATFFSCFNLSKVDNLISSGVTTSISVNAFHYCRATFDLGGNLNSWTYTLGSNTIKLHNTKFWEAVDYKPYVCSNPALSFLDQYDLRWQTVIADPQTGMMLGECCDGLSIMGAWCSLNNVTADHPREFLDICDKYGADFADIIDGVSASACAEFWAAMGLECVDVLESSISTAEGLRNLYSALADGKYVVITVAGSPIQYEGHVVAVTGLTPQGELIIQDSGNTGWQQGARGSRTGKIPIQNLISTTRYGDGNSLRAVILSKKAVT